MSSNGVNHAFDVSSLEQLEAYIQNKVINLDYFVESSNLVEGAKHVALSLFPTWKEKDLKLEQFTDGITNKRK